MSIGICAKPQSGQSLAASQEWLVDKDSGCIPLDLYHILYLNLFALPVRDEDKD